MPQVTIGLPVYNSRRTLSLAIQSVLDQTLSDWELIICDDGSTDGSIEVAAAVRDLRVRVVRNERNVGLSASLNRIVSLATAPLIARMDSDDLLHPDRLRMQAGVFAAKPNLDVVSTEAFVVDDENRVIGGRRRSKVARTTAEVLTHNGPIHASVMARRAWCARFPYSNDFRRGEDLELWARALPRSAHYHMGDRLYFIRENPHVSVAKYCRTISAHSAIFRQYAGAEGITHMKVAALTLRSHVRMGAYSVAGCLGLQSRIAARRIEPLPPETSLEAQTIVDRIVADTKAREEVLLAIR